jgi:hypothetical protein
LKYVPCVFYLLPGRANTLEKSTSFTAWKNLHICPRFTPGFQPSAPPGGKAGYKKGMPRRRGDFLRRGTGCRILQSRAASMVGYYRVERKAAYVFIAGLTVHVPVDVHVAEHRKHCRGVFCARGLPLRTEQRAAEAVGHAVEPSKLGRILRRGIRNNITLPPYFITYFNR